MSEPAKIDSIQQSALEQFGRQSHRYGAGHILADTSDITTALERIELPVTSQVLDVATGGGHAGLHLAALGHEVVCSDLTASMLERVSEAAAARGLHVITRQHPAEALPYPDASFDLVTCRVAPHHFSSPADFVRESARVLRSGGWFLMIDGSVQDDQAEAEAWLHQVEKLRDPSHNRLLTPQSWIALCVSAGLEVQSAVLVPFKQPDLEWYFETANTPPENRVAVRRLIDQAPESARQLFGLAVEDTKVVWWWPRLTLIARKPLEGDAPSSLWPYPASRGGTEEPAGSAFPGGSSLPFSATGDDGETVSQPSEKGLYGRRC